MKKKNIINLIKYHTEKNESGFRTEAYEIANDFEANGDEQLAEYIMALMSDTSTFVPQINDDNLSFFKKINVSNASLSLPNDIIEDIMGIANAIDFNMGVNKFLFTGAPGTGKTECVKHIARILDRELFAVDFPTVIDSKLGQTQKNIKELFKEINSIPNPQKVIILFDEIDALSMDRTNNNDLREMGRATSSVLNELDNLNENIVIIATTNLFKYFDKALVRRFDSIVSFDRYEVEDLVTVAVSILNELLGKFKNLGHNERLFKKIIEQMNPILSPGEIKNKIKTCIAFSDKNDPYDYLRRLYKNICEDANLDLKYLQSKGFTLREIEIITGISRSQASRDLRSLSHE